MPSSPYTPRHSRHSSAFDSFSGSPQARRLSKSSTHDPSSPYHNSFNQQDALEMSGNGMGNLADELADAFSDSGDEDNYIEGDDDGDSLGPAGDGQNRRTSDDGDLTDTGNAAGQNGNRTDTANLTVSPRRRGHQRQTSGYDGSQYGSESDLDSPGIPPGLVAKMDAIESLARRGTENYGGPADDVVKRVTNALRDLGSQSSVEGSASRSVQFIAEPPETPLFIERVIIC